MRVLLLLALVAAFAAPAAAQPVAARMIAQASGDPYESAWAAEVKDVLVLAYDRNRSGLIDTPAEVDGVECEVWQALQDAVSGGIRSIYGFSEGYTWVGTDIGFAEAQRARADRAAAACLPGEARAEEIRNVPGAGSTEWKEAVGRYLVRTYDRDRSGSLGAAEAVAIECDVWQAIENGYAQGEYDEFWVGYGFAPDLIWNASDMGFDEASREPAYADMSACRNLQSDDDGGGDSGSESDAASTTYSQRLESELDAGDSTLRSGEYVENWVLYAVAGQQITVEMMADDFDPYLILKSPSGEQFDNDDWNGNTRISRIVVDNAEEGTWTAMSTSYATGSVGSYAVTLSVAYPSTSLSSPTKAGELAGTTWAEDCPGSNPARSYVRLNADGSFAWSHTSPAEVVSDGGDTWRVNNGQLAISWNGGYAVTQYTLSGNGILSGSSSMLCGTEARLLRMP